MVWPQIGRLNCNTARSTVATGDRFNTTFLMVQALVCKTNITEFNSLRSVLQLLLTHKAKAINE